MRKSVGFVILGLMAAFTAGFLLTATGAAAVPPQRPRSVQITVEVFLDTVGHTYSLPCPGCNGFWDGGDWCGELLTPFPPVTVILRDAETNEEIARQTTQKNYSNGRSYAYFNVPAGDDFILELGKVPDGFESCPTSSLSRLITPYDYPLGFRLERFYFWWGCPPVPPHDGPPPPPPPGTGTSYIGCGVYPIFNHTP